MADVIRSPRTTFLFDGIDLVDVEGKGLGYVATRAVACGQLIMQEDSLTSTPFTKGCKRELAEAKLSLAYRIVEFLDTFPVLECCGLEQSFFEDTAEIWDGYISRLDVDDASK